MADRGRNALAQGDLSAAARELAVAFAVMPNEPVRAGLLEASWRYARQLIDRGELGAAAEHLQCVLRLEPANETAADLLARVLWTLGDRAGASEVLSKLLARDVSHAGRIRALALVRAAQGQSDAAAALLAKLGALPAGAEPAPPWADVLVQLAVRARQAGARPLTAMFASAPDDRIEKARAFALSSRHHALLQAFSAQVHRSLEEELSALRQAVSAAPDGSGVAGPSADAAGRLRRTIEPHVATLVSHVEDTLRQAPSSGWELTAARRLSLLLEPTPPAVPRPFEEIPIGAPPGLRALMDLLEDLVTGHCARALDRAIEAVDGLPPKVLELAIRWTVRNAAAERGAVLAILARRIEVLPPDLRLPVGRMLRHEGKLEAALTALAAATERDADLEREAAQVLDALGRPAEAHARWMAAIDSVLAQPTTPGKIPAWLPPVLAQISLEAERPVDLEKLSRRIAARFPDSSAASRLHAAALLSIDHVTEAVPIVLGLARARPADPGLKLAAASVRFLDEEPYEALELLQSFEPSPGDPLAQDVVDLEELALHEWLDDVSPELARPYLERRRRRSGPQALFLLHEADLENQRVPGGGQELIELALQACLRDRAGAVECGIIQIRRGDVPLGVRFLRTVTTLAGLPLQDAAAAVGHLLAVGDVSHARRVLDDHLDRQESDDLRAELLALSAVELVDQAPEDVSAALELLTRRALELEPGSQHLRRELLELGRMGTLLPAPSAASNALSALRRHAYGIEDSWELRVRSLKKKLIRELVAGTETTAGEDEALAAAADLPAPDACQQTPPDLVRDALLEFAAWRLGIGYTAGE